MIRSRTLSSIDYVNPALVQLLHVPVLHWLASPGLATISLLEPGSPEFADRVGGFFARAAFIPRMFGVEFDPALGLSHEQMKTLGETSAVVRFREVQS